MPIDFLEYGVSISTHDNVVHRHFVTYCSLRVKSDTVTHVEMLNNMLLCVHLRVTSILENQGTLSAKQAGECIKRP